MVRPGIFADINKCYTFEELRFGFTFDGPDERDLERIETKTGKVEKLVQKLKDNDPIYHRVQVRRAAERIVALDDMMVVRVLRSKFKKPSSWQYRKNKVNKIKLEVKPSCPSCKKPPGPGRHKPSCEVINNKKLEKRLNVALSR